MTTASGSDSVRLTADGGDASLESVETDAPDVPLCVFDLDETLVYSNRQPFDGAVCLLLKNGIKMYTKLRPRARETLVGISRTWHVAVWSAGSTIYVTAVVAAFFSEVSFRFVWSCRQCVQENSGAGWPGVTAGASVRKPLALIERQHRYPLRRIVVVDDRETTAAGNLRNLVLMPPYNGEAHNSDLDDALQFLEHYLRSLFSLYRGCEVGDVDKRGWLDETRERLESYPSAPTAATAATTSHADKR